MNQEGEDSELGRISMTLEQMRQDRELEWIQGISDNLLTLWEKHFHKSIDTLSGVVNTRSEELSKNIKKNCDKIESLTTEARTSRLISTIETVKKQDVFLAELRSIGIEQSRIIYTLAKEVEAVTAQMNINAALLRELRDEMQQVKLNSSSSNTSSTDASS